MLSPDNRKPICIQKSPNCADFQWEGTLDEEPTKRKHPIGFFSQLLNNALVTKLLNQSNFLAKETKILNQFSH